MTTATVDRQNLHGTPMDESSQTLVELRRIVSDKPIDIVVSSTDMLFLEGIAALVGQWDEFRVVAKATDDRSTLKACKDAEPCVCLLNTRLNDSSYTNLTANIVKQAPGAKVIVLSPSGSDDDVIEALRAGIHGYCIQNDISADRLRGMIWGIMSGGVMLYGLERSKLQAAHEQPKEKSTEEETAFDVLSKREREILALLTRGLSNAEIGQELYLSEATVKKNIARITDKLQVENRVQAAVLAARHMS